MRTCKTFELKHVVELRLPLVDRFYADCNYNVKCGRLDRVFTYESKGKIIAAARLLESAPNNLLLRNLCVLPELRHQGIASCLLKDILSSISPTICYCFALPHLKNFYLTLGFSELPVEQVPPAVADMHIRNQLRKRGWLLMGAQY